VLLCAIIHITRHYPRVLYHPVKNSTPRVSSDAFEAWYSTINIIRTDTLIISRKSNGYIATQSFSLEPCARWASREARMTFSSSLSSYIHPCRFCWFRKAVELLTHPSLSTGTHGSDLTLPLLPRAPRAESTNIMRMRIVVGE
jgi:hypothetical protein